MFDGESFLAEAPKPWKTFLIDALYFHAARQAHARADEAEKSITAARERWETLEDAEREILERHEQDSHAAYDELEPICMQMEDAHYQLGASHAPLLKEAAVVHFLCAAALEAHINAVAKEVLAGKEEEQFERCALEAKWLFLPKLLGCSGFDLGHQPFQGFARLVKFRNELVHYKGFTETWVYGAIPEFVPKLGLTLPDSAASIEAVSGMIREFMRQRGVEPPGWLRIDDDQMNYFEILAN